MIKIEEQSLVEQFIAHAPVEALDETILHRRTIPARGSLEADAIRNDNGRKVCVRIAVSKIKSRASTWPSWENRTMTYLSLDIGKLRSVLAVSVRLCSLAVTLLVASASSPRWALRSASA